MMTVGGARLECLPALFAFLFAGCGRELKLQPRQVLAPGDISQFYEVNVNINADASANFYALVNFTATDTGSPVTLPAGDTLTVNNTAMAATPAPQLAYFVSGNDNPGTFTFVWTHGSTSYTNTLTATSYQATVPPTVSKSAPQAITLTGVPADVQVSADVFIPNSSSGPVALPLTVNGAVVQSASSSLASVPNGANTVSVSERSNPTLQAGTTSGASCVVSVQQSYTVTIGN